MASQEIISTIPYLEGINPYHGTLFEKYFLNKPTVYKRDDGEKVVVYHFVDSNSTEYFPVQVILHPQGQLRGFYKISWLKIFHYPKKDQPNYFELMIKNFEPLSDVDKVEKFKKDLIKKSFLKEEEFYKYVEDKMKYRDNIKPINTMIDFTLYTL